MAIRTVEVMRIPECLMQQRAPVLSKLLADWKYTYTSVISDGEYIITCVTANTSRVAHSTFALRLIDAAMAVGERDGATFAHKLQEG